MKYNMLQRQDVVLHNIARYGNTCVTDDLFECCLGRQENHRITQDSSMTQKMTDPATLFKTCLYPLYQQHKTEVKLSVESAMERLSNSDDPLAIFQGIRMINMQEIMLTLYDDVPFMFDVKPFAIKLQKQFYKHEQYVRNYKGEDFAKSTKTMYDVTLDIMNRTAAFKDIKPDMVLVHTSSKRLGILAPLRRRKLFGRNN